MTARKWTGSKGHKTYIHVPDAKWTLFQNLQKKSWRVMPDSKSTIIRTRKKKFESHAWQETDSKKRTRQGRISSRDPIEVKSGEFSVRLDWRYPPQKRVKLMLENHQQKTPKMLTSIRNPKKVFLIRKQGKEKPVPFLPAKPAHTLHF